MISPKVPESQEKRDYHAVENRRRRLNVEMGERLRSIIHKQTVRAVSAEMGFHPQSVRRWLQGDSSPPAAFLIAVCERFGVSADWLLLGIGPARPDHEASGSHAGVVDPDIIEKMAKLGEELRTLAIQAQDAMRQTDPRRSGSDNHDTR